MSLTSLISGSYKVFFKEIIPAKKEFNTISGKRAFSKADYTEYVKYKLENPHDATVVGTAFDYLARWIIAKTVNTGKETSYSGLVAEKGIWRCEIVAKRTGGGNIQEKYDKGIMEIERFVNGANNRSQIIKVAIFFAKLEQIWRSNALLFMIDIDKLLQIEDAIFDDLVELINLFQRKMIDSGIVNENSTVVFNPTFGGASRFCGGADADIYIDGTIYDFKCTKTPAYKWQEVAQILGYYLLDNISKNNNDMNNKLNGHEIDRLAFYRARFGEIEYYDIQRKMYTDAMERLEEMLGKEKYQKYLDEIQNET